MSARIDQWGFRQQRPTADEILQNLRVTEMDVPLSLWEARCISLHVMLCGEVHPETRRVRFFVVIPFEHKKPDTARRDVRFVEVLPPDDGDEWAWSWRPVNPQTWTALPWSSLAENEADANVILAEIAEELGPDAKVPTLNRPQAEGVTQNGQGATS